MESVDDGRYPGQEIIFHREAWRCLVGVGVVREDGIFTPLPPQSPFCRRSYEAEKSWGGRGAAHKGKAGSQGFIVYSHHHIDFIPRITYAILSGVLAGGH